MERDRFGPKGHLEVTSELLIHQASVGKGPAILEILLDGLIHPDVADCQGHTALIAATVKHNEFLYPGVFFKFTLEIIGIGLACFVS